MMAVLTSRSAVAQVKKPSADTADREEASLGRVASIADRLAAQVKGTVDEIVKINRTTRLVSINAQIEAARAGGQVGAAFAVVAGAIQGLSANTANIAEQMSTEASVLIADLQRVSHLLATRWRGERLADLARMNGDLIDRNLFERTADVRWWATDSSLVDALDKREDDLIARASTRLGVILSAYTVYFDIVLCDLRGRVLANGKPEQFRSVDSDVSRAAWFTSAKATATGDEYGFEGVHRSPLVGDKAVLVYSCAVRAGGATDAPIVGVLGVIFDWEDLSGGVIGATPIEEAEKSATDICFVDDDGRVLAGNHQQKLGQRIEFNGLHTLLRTNQGFTSGCVDGKEAVVAHAKAPGYQGYSTGWHSLIIQHI